jgi:glycosyltransferase involved in cell wall biosynthesis
MALSAVRGRKSSGVTFTLILTALPDYRQRVLERMASRIGSGFVVLAGKEYFQPTVQTAIDLGAQLQVVENRFLLGRRALWQSIPIRRAVGSDVVMATMNPRVLSTWVVLLARRLRRRRTVLWGHAWPRAGKGVRSDRLRQLQRALADAVVVYTESQRADLQQLMGGKPVYAAPNAIYRRADIRPAPTPAATSDFIYVARLVPSKKPMLLLEAFVRAAATLPSEARLVFVGDGPLRSALEGRAREAGLADRVVFTGHVSEPDRLRELYASAVASVSPGYVGLSITQSLGFGVPMLFARDEPHSPEIEAAVEDQNSRSVSSDDPVAMATGLVRFYEERELWVKRRQQLSEWIAERYTAEVMADRLLAAGLGEPPARQETPSSAAHVA